MLETMPKTKQTTIVFNLGKILRDRKLTQKAAAELFGLSRQSVGTLAGNPEQIKIETIQKICNGLNITPAELFVMETGKEN